MKKNCSYVKNKNKKTIGSYLRLENILSNEIIAEINC